jgi:pimeloyl-ACP methyl ester carboxylesterase
MDGTGLMFAPFIAALGPDVDCRVVAYPTDRPLDYAEHEAIAREALPSETPYVILGESFSGPIAIRIATSAPDNLRGLVLCCSFARSPQPLLACLRPLTHVLKSGALPMWALNLLLLGRFSTAPLRAALSTTVHMVSAATMMSRLRSVIDVDASTELSAIDVPCMYLRATEDRLVPEAAARLIQKLRPGLQVVDVVAPHGLLQTVPEVAAKLVMDFARSAIRV